MKVIESTLEKTPEEVLHAKATEKKKIVPYLFYLLHRRIGVGEIFHKQRAAENWLTFLVKEDCGGGWCRCTYRPAAQAYDLEYGQDCDQRRVLITVTSGYYSDGVCQPSPMPGTKPDVRTVNEKIISSLTDEENTEKANHFGEILCFIRRELRKLKPFLDKTVIPENLSDN